MALICRSREKQRRNRRDRQFFSRLANRREHVGPGDFEQLLPPRSQWPRAGKLRRDRAARSGIDAQTQLLVDHILRRWGEPNRTAPLWLKRLRRFVQSVRSRVLGSHAPALSRPSVVAIPKGRKDADGALQFRCLAVYAVEDQIAVSIVALYFRRLFDACFDRGSLAFRASKGGRPPNHHDAIEQILRFRAESPPGRCPNIWAAEVDIRGFFDTVGHEEAIRAVEDLERAANTSADPRAWALLRAYLASYSFNLFGRSEAEKAAARRAGDVPTTVPWPEQTLRELGRATRAEPIGIPQGGALSCFLANAVLHSADAAVRAAIAQKPALYLRYCDDIVILTRTRDACHKALGAYQRELTRLKLPAHPPQRVPYGPAFWAAKSKRPYRWARGHVPWCAFVGYHVRCDGVLRIRPSSLEKERRKQRTVVTTAIETIARARKRGRGVRSRQAIYRVRQKLRSISVGTTLLHLNPTRSAFCWAEGFRMVAEHPCILSQLRDLDRNRGRLLGKLRHALSALRDPGRGVRKQLPSDALKYEGRPYSYTAINDDRTWRLADPQQLEFAFTIPPRSRTA